MDASDITRFLEDVMGPLGAEEGCVAVSYSHILP